MENEQATSRSYQGGIQFVLPGGKYSGQVEVSFDAGYPDFDPQLKLSVSLPGGAATFHGRRDLTPGELRELAAACNMAADACEKARQSKAA